MKDLEGFGTSKTRAVTSIYSKLVSVKDSRELKKWSKDCGKKTVLDHDEIKISFAWAS